MSHDLRQGLHDLSQSERPFLDDLPIALLQKRAHRRRVHRAATYSAVGAGAVAALAVGGIAGAAALRQRGAEPAAPPEPVPVPTASQTPTPTRSATPTPTVTASPNPTEEPWAPDWEACGWIIGNDSFIDPDAEYWWVAVGTERQFSPRVDEPFELDLELRTSSPEVQAVEARLVDVWAMTYDEAAFTWEVVGVAAGPLDNLTQGVLQGPDEYGELSMPLNPVEVQMISCAGAPDAGGDGTGDVPLDGDWYELATRTDVTTADGETLTTVAFAGMIGVYPPEPEHSADPTVEPTSPGPGIDEPFHLVPGVPLRLGTELTMNNATKSAQEQESFCGKDTSTVTLLPNTPQAPATFSATAFLTDGELVVQMTTTNTGPASAGAVIGLPMAYIARDGRLVGLVQNPTSPFAIDQWPTAESVQYELAVGRFTCTYMLGEPWPTGTYEILYQQSLRLGDGTSFAMSGRSAFTIE